MHAQSTSLGLTVMVTIVAALITFASMQHVHHSFSSFSVIPRVLVQ